MASLAQEPGAPETITVCAGTGFVRVDWVGAIGELDGKPGSGNIPPGQNPWVHAMGTLASYIAKCRNDDCTTYNASQSSHFPNCGGSLSGSATQ
ncbi:hypothetical protein DFJ43DRAFT_1160655 [Lentinula guzmanii]|uniref:Uncharacterized protein n=1 Tax=Lentinula guzmanii TaxID=2804957 RepID=A0AA38JAN6_9AGAR|nr:hypothetical protein DFJ43DRAFT_1160655 [Lentinula guzmanii]